MFEGANYLNFSSAAENNKEPILARLAELFTYGTTALEIGSGSGQHIVYFARALSQIMWQPTDQGRYFEGLKTNIERFAPENVRPPEYLDLEIPDWPLARVDHIYAANVVHIMSAQLLTSLFSGAARTLVVDGLLCLYGPFKYNGRFTTESNKHFDGWLKARDPQSGVRDFEVLCELGSKIGLELLHDFSMPANNQLLVFKYEGTQNG